MLNDHCSLLAESARSTIKTPINVIAENASDCAILNGSFPILASTYAIAAPINNAQNTVPIILNLSTSFVQKNLVQIYINSILTK